MKNFFIVVALALGFMLALTGCLFLGNVIWEAINNPANTPPPGTISAPPVESSLDTTEIGHDTASYWEVNTPDGAIPCIVLEPHGVNQGPSIDCDWSVIR